MGNSSLFPSTLVSTLWTALLLVLSVAAGVHMEANAHHYLTGLELPAFLAIPLKYQSEAPIIRTLAGVLAGFLAFFALGYLLQALWDAFRLGLVNMSLGGVIRRGGFADPDAPPSRLGWLYYPLFTRLWRDFCATLHPQRDAEGEGVRYRATAPAEIYFSVANLVDAPMRVEFFRHLPGILTGAGIVSTFAGILLGLTEFNPTVAADQVTLQLKNLFTGVSTAFVASFFAIFSAIVVTVVEKLVLHWRYAQVGQLQGRLDDLFQGGVEPEYLAQLNRNSALLGSGLERMGVTLAAGQGRGGEVPALDADSLGQLLRKTVQELGGQQEASGQQLRQVLQELGGQQQAVGQQLQQALQALGGQQQSAGQQLRQVVQELGGRQEASGQQLRQVVQELGGQQQASGQQLQQVVQELAEQQQAAMSRLEALVRDGVGAPVGQMAGALGQVSQALEQLMTAQREALAVQQELVASHQEMLNAQGQTLQAIQAARQEAGATADSATVKAMGEVASRLVDLSAKLDTAMGGAATRMEGLSEGLSDVRQATNVSRDVIDAGFNKLLLRLEADSVRAERELAALEEVVSKGAAIESGVGSVREALERLQTAHAETEERLLGEVRSLSGQLDRQEGAQGETLSRLEGEIIRQGERREALSQQLLETLRELSDSEQGAARERDAFLLARLRESHGELDQRLREEHGALAERMAQNFQEELSEQGQEIVASVNAVRDGQEALQAEQARLHQEGAQRDQALNQGLLNAFSQAIRESVERLAEQMGEMTRRLSEERQAMEGNIQHLIDGLAAATREGGDNLAGQLEKAMAGAEVRQDGMLEALTRMTAAMRGDLNLLQERIQETSREIGSDLARQTRELVEQTGASTGEAIAQSSEALALELKNTLDKLAADQQEEGQDRTLDLMGHMESGNKELADRMRQSLQAELQESVRMVTESIRATGATQKEQAQALADMMMANVAGQLEEKFGGLSNGITELRQRLNEENRSIKDAMHAWIEKLNQSNKEEARQLAASIRQVMEQAENRHNGMLGALNQMNDGLSGELNRTRDNLLNQASENSDILARHVNEVVTTANAEQTVFIEMLGERLETLRRRLKVK